MSYEMLSGMGDTTTLSQMPSQPGGGGSIIPAGGSGIGPGGSGIGPGGSGISPTGSTLSPPPGASWSYAPVVILAMQTNASLFTTGVGDVENWRRFVLQMMLKSGVLDPGRSSEAEGAAQALSQAYGWFIFHDLESVSTAMQATWAAYMYEALHHDIVAISVYQAAHPDSLTITGKQISRTDLMKFHKPLVAPPPTAAPPPAASSNALLYVGGAAVLGGAAYFFLR